jgi:hypothetical protein
MGSRSSSMDSLYNLGMALINLSILMKQNCLIWFLLDGDAPDTIELIRQVSTNQNAVMAFYYTDADNQVRTRFPEIKVYKSYFSSLTTVHN